MLLVDLGLDMRQDLSFKLRYIEGAQDFAAIALPKGIRACFRDTYTIEPLSLLKALHV